MLRRLLLFSLPLIVCHAVRAQTPPCGIAIIKTDGANIDERFIAAPPEQVKVALLKALPAMAAKVHKDEGLHIEARSDPELYAAILHMNRQSGAHGFYGGLGAFGTFTIDLREALQAGVKGSLLHIEFHKNAVFGRMGNEGYPRPLAEETECLVKTLSTNDPAKNPRGLASKEAAPPRAVVLPDGTPLKVILYDAMYSKNIKKDSAGQTVRFEVAEDVVVDGVALVRRGALVTGHFKKAEKAKAYAHSAKLDFTFDTVTAADGQELRIGGATERGRGSERSKEAAIMGILVYVDPITGFFIKGNEVFIRAGTSYDLQVSGQATIDTGK
jgi:hypothetical protein